MLAVWKTTNMKPQEVEKILKEFDEAFRNSSIWENAENNEDSIIHEIKFFIKKHLTALEQSVREDVAREINNMESPEHDDTSDGAFCKCWCLPKQMVAVGGFIFVH